MSYWEDLSAWLAQEAATAGIEYVGLSIRCASGWTFTRMYRDGFCREASRHLPLFRVGSLSKMLAVATLFKAADRQVLNPTITLPCIFPELALPSRSPLALATLADLAGHRSPLGRIDGSVLRDHEGRYRSPIQPMRGQSLLSHIRRAKINGPGRGLRAFDYSDFGVALIGQALEKATGGSYATLAERDVLRPNDISGFYPSLRGISAEVGRRLLRGHSSPDKTMGLAPSNGLDALDPAMGAVATIAAVTDLLHALLTGAILSQAHTRMVRDTRTPFGPPNKGYRYGLGIARFPVGAIEGNDACYGHLCIFEGFCGFAAHHPASGTTAAMMANTLTGNDRSRRELNPSGFVRHVFNDLAAHSNQAGDLVFRPWPVSPLWR